ncbi:MAG: hypothetical protein M0R51_08565 [Clostridia bacterium]|nr:hypothetical protein [Clostridia bacterium]
MTEQNKTENKTLNSIYQRRMHAKILLSTEKFEESFQNSQYKTVSIDVIMSKIRKAHAEAGILLEIDRLESYNHDVITSNIGKNLRLHTAIIPFTFINPDDPKDRCTVKVSASVLGTESDDKYMAKLYTSGLKILCKIEYAISGMNDDDIDAIADLEAELTKPTKSSAKATYEKLTNNTRSSETVPPFVTTLAESIVEKSPIKMKVVVRPKEGASIVEEKIDNENKD